MTFSSFSILHAQTAERRHTVHGFQDHTATQLTGNEKHETNNQLSGFHSCSMCADLARERQTDRQKDIYYREIEAQFPHHPNLVYPAHTQTQTSAHNVPEYI